MEHIAAAAGAGVAVSNTNGLTRDYHLNILNNRLSEELAETPNEITHHIVVPAPSYETKIRTLGRYFFIYTNATHVS